jgi:monovalent cation:H+ antiporter-2, CPA2 family
VEEFSLLRDFAIIMVVAGVVTLVLRRLHQPPVLGYLLAGLIISPYVLPFFSVTDIHTIGLLADIGLVLLLFGVGLEFGWSKIRQIGLAALVIGTIEIATMISLGYGLGQLLGWSRTDALFLGAALHTSSSAIIVKILKDLGKLNLVSSRVIVGVLLVEDFAAVIIIAILSGVNTPGIASFGNIASLGLKLVIFIVSSLVIGALVVPRILAFPHKLHSRETLLVVSLALCFAMALISKELGLSVATGAFIIGALVGDTTHSEEIVEVMSPVRDMFAALFFVAIGMLIDISKFRDFLLPAVIVAAVFIIGKVLINTIASIISGYSARTSLQVGTAMPQMGEFSLAIAKVGVDRGATAAPLYPVIAIATTLTSIIAPYLTRSADTLADFLGRKSPRIAQEYIIHLNDWGQTVRRLLPQQNEAARKIRGSIRNISINILILLVIIGAGTFALQYVEALAASLPVRRDVIALILGFSILVLCIPSMVLIWRNLRALIDEITRQVLHNSVLEGERRGEVIRAILRYSIIAVLSILIILWLIPFIFQIFFIGSLALAIPALLLALALYLVLRSISGVQRHLERTVSQVFLGEQTSSQEGVTSPDVRLSLVRRLFQKMMRLVTGKKPHQPSQPTVPDSPVKSGHEKNETAGFEKK